MRSSGQARTYPARTYQDGIMRKPTRGRHAEAPGEIPKCGWKDISWRVIRAARRDRITMLAAGVAFYALLALFPTIAAVISLWGLLFDPYEAGQQLYEISRFMPLMPPN
ncbi:hypothetical protein HSBAA_47450 [Vreelandella sulfidaeris]|uniref:Uncharacterized protein n=1 Tax=Vreelandella sulfidaeris TaxID=115553 RepID=A0A455UGV5_9GAMM|nr:hypothetical protein HSBAA_47450 [Halomonas sulfidaeris]